uniref:Putative secreted protein n=1 Tax=Anopheles nuneztovari TaxID=30067 RepID=A0A2M3YWF5_9DIPT
MAATMSCRRRLPLPLMMMMMVAAAALVVSTMLVGAMASPDFAVPARMTGVGSGNLDRTGNVVQNANRVLAVLEQFQSITEWLYSLQTPDLYRLATRFRTVMDSLVETGSPIFQALSNAARLSSGNITSLFAGIQRSIDVTVALNNLHQLTINETRPFLGEAGVHNISTVLDLLVRNVRNLSAVLDEIEPTLVELQLQLLNASPSPAVSTALVERLYPRVGVRKLNDILLNYVNIGVATVPQINAVVNRVRLMDGFIGRLDSVATTQQNSLNASLASVNSTIRNYVEGRLRGAVRGLAPAFNRSVTEATRKLRPLMADQVLQEVAGNATGRLTERLTTVTQTLDTLADRIEVPLEQADRTARVIMNLTVVAISELAWNLTLAVTSAQPGAEACFRRYGYEFDKLARQLYDSLSGCGQGEARALQSVTGALIGFLGVVQTQLDAEARTYDQCLGGLSVGSPADLKRQRALCLEVAVQYSQLVGGTVVANQLASFGGVLQRELTYSGDRHGACLLGSYRLLVTEVVYLRDSLTACLNPPATR